MRARRQAHAGFTLMEVIMAVTILSAVILMMAAPASKFLSVSSKAEIRVAASAAADAQIALVRMYPNYDSLKVKFDSTRTNYPFAGYTQNTDVVRSNPNTTSDITRVVVTISGPQLSPAIKRTATIAAP